MPPLDLCNLEYYYRGMTKLREVMDEKGVTLAEIAASTGLDTKTIWHATKSKKIRRSTRIAIAGFFGLPEPVLFPAPDIPKCISEQIPA